MLSNLRLLNISISIPPPILNPPEIQIFNKIDAIQLVWKYENEQTPPLSLPFTYLENVDTTKNI